MPLSIPLFRLKRQAKDLAKSQRIPLHQAQNQIARKQGFAAWSHLMAQRLRAFPGAQTIGVELRPGDLLLVAGRPGQGKTLFGLQLLADAITRGQKGYCFTLECTPKDVLTRFADLDIPLTVLQQTADAFTLDTSDGICAQYIMETAGAIVPGTIVLVDYLQLLDQKRTHPPLDQQLWALKEWANVSGAIVVILSQIDRKFAASGRTMPNLEDVRQPNPMDLSLFTGTVFLHDGTVNITRAA